MDKNVKVVLDKLEYEKKRTYAIYEDENVPEKKSHLNLAKYLDYNHAIEIVKSFLG